MLPPVEEFCEVDGAVAVWIHACDDKASDAPNPHTPHPWTLLPRISIYMLALAYKM